MKKPVTPKTKTSKTTPTPSKNGTLPAITAAKDDSNTVPAAAAAVAPAPANIVDGDDFYELMEETAHDLELVLNQITAAKNAVKARFGVKKDTASYELVCAMNYAATTGRRFKRAVDAAESVTKRHGI